MRLLLVDDNKRLAELTADQLRARGFCPDIALTIDDAKLAILSAEYDLLILDLGLPDGDGLAAQG